MSADLACIPSLSKEVQRLASKASAQLLLLEGPVNEVVEGVSTASQNLGQLAAEGSSSQAAMPLDQQIGQLLHTLSDAADNAANSFVGQLMAN